MEDRMREDEIDLMDLIRIIYDSRRLIIGVALVITLLSLGGALYMRAQTNNYTAVNFLLNNNIDSFYQNKANLKIRTFDHREILKDDKVVDELMGLETIKNYVKDSESSMNENEKRRFLEELIKLKSVEEEVDRESRLRYYQLEVEQLKGLDEKTVMEKYLELINRSRYMLYIDAVEEEYEDVKKNTELYEKELKKVNEKINGFIEKEPDLLLQNEGLVGVLTVKYPIEIREQIRLNELYQKYSDELVGLEGIKTDKRLEEQVEVVSSFYEVKAESKAKLIVVLGMVVGVISGILCAFIGVFIKTFRKEILK